MSDGDRRVFRKERPGAPAGFFEAEARGLRWLAEAGAPVPAILDVEADAITLEWIDEAPRTAASDLAAGHALASLHAAGAPAFGGPDGADGFIGTLPLDGTPSDDWPTHWAEHRVRPLVRQLLDSGGLDPAGAAALDRCCDRLAERAGPVEAPARLHGDLWSGNLLADRAGRPWFVDPAACGGHRETDLAMLALFGGLTDAFVAGYEDVTPLSDGWRERQDMHQLHPLLVHARLFGGGYGRRAVEVARRWS